MKRWLAILTLLVFVVVLPAASFAVTQSRYDMVVEQRDALYQQLADAGMEPCVDIKADLPDLPSIEKTDDYEIVRQYDRFKPDDIWGDKYYRYMIIKNTSGEAANFVGQIMYFDAEDNLIGVSNPETDTVENGYEGLLVCVNETKFDHIKYVISKEKNQNVAFDSFLDVQTTINKDKVIVIATNKGDIDLDFLKCRVLFFNKGEIVGDEDVYMIDNDDKLKAGKMEFRELAPFRQEFDAVEVFFHSSTWK